MFFYKAIGYISARIILYILWPVLFCGLNIIVIAKTIKRWLKNNLPYPNKAKELARW